MWRLTNKFEDEDEKNCSDFVVWGSLILHFCNLYLDKKRERSMSDFLLDVVKYDLLITFMYFIWFLFVTITQIE